MILINCKLKFVFFVLTILFNDNELIELKRNDFNVTNLIYQKV